MSASPEFIALVKDLFAPLGGITSRSMFGGVGIYSRGVMFGLVYDDTLYLKADGDSQPAFEARKCGPFVYENSTGKPVVTSYWQMPAELVDDAEEARAWAKTALDVARAARSDLPPPSRRITASRWRR